MFPLLLLLILPGSNRFADVFLDDGQLILEAAPQITLMSLSPEPAYSGREEQFRGYRVLAKRELRGREKRRRPYRSRHLFRMP